MPRGQMEKVKKMLTKSKTTVTVFSVAVLGVSILLALFIAHGLAFAAVGSGGSGGGGGGGAGSPQTRSGHGWYIVSSDSSATGPARFRGSGMGTWADAKALCRAEGASQMVAYIVLTSTERISDAWVYDGYFPENWQGFRGNSGGNWRTASQARAMFNTLPSSERQGFTFGDNVAWFCYNTGSFNLQTRSYVTTDTGSWGADGRDITVRPGTTVYFRHQVQNTGNITASYQGRRDTYAGSWSNGTWGSMSTNASSTWTSTAYSVAIPGNATDGSRYCQRYNTDRTSSSSGTSLTSDQACAVVQHQWNIVPSISITSPPSNNAPGDEIVWRHRITNGGSNQTSGTITYHAQNQGGLGTGNAETWTATNIPPTGLNYREETSTYRITQADIGSTICRRTTATPGASDNNGMVVSDAACVSVPYEYNLVPTISTPSSRSVVESDSRPVDVSGQITNSGPTKSPTNIRWQLSEIVYPPGTVNIPNQSGGVGVAPCSFFTVGNCRSISDGTEADGYGGAGPVGPGNPQPSQTYTSTGQMTDNPPGTAICYAISVQPNSHSSNEWRHSQLHCLIVGKHPKVQVWGNGVQVGRTFSGSTNISAKVAGGIVTKSAGGTFGSWSEYGIFAPSSITLIASGAGLNVPTGHTSANQDAWSAYSFTKRSGTNNYGAYNYNNPSLPDVTTVFSRGNAQQVALSSDPNRHYDVTAIASNPAQNNRSIRPRDADAGTTNITVGASNPTQSLATSQWLVINAQRHNVTITSNIVYANGPFSTTDQIPQLVIIADNITIADTVSRVDAWLIAKNDSTRPTAHGAIATCNQQAGGATSAQWLAATSGPTTTNYESSSADLTVAHCTTPLQINGPVIANKLFLRRTAGSGTLTTAPNRPGDPAETINLRPDAYLWARTQMSPGLVYQVTTERELPPRY